MRNLEASPTALQHAASHLSFNRMLILISAAHLILTTRQLLVSLSQCGPHNTIKIFMTKIPATFKAFMPLHERRKVIVVDY